MFGSLLGDESEDISDTGQSNNNENDIGDNEEELDEEVEDRGFGEAIVGSEVEDVGVNEDGK
jgi:hypothetical protein